MSWFRKRKPAPPRVEILPPADLSGRVDERRNLTDRQRAAAIATDRYYENITRPDELRKIGRTAEALDLAIALVDLLPSVVADWRRDTGEFAIQSIPPIDCALTLAAVTERRDVVDKVALVIASVPELAPWKGAALAAVGDIDTVRKIRELLEISPGTIQAKVPKLVQVPGTDTRRLIHHLDAAGKIHREKVGNSYALRWADA